MSRPPHLPDSHLDHHDHKVRSRNMYTLFAMIAFALAAGAVGALMVFAWIVPGGYMNEGQWVPRGQNPGIVTPFAEPETSLVRKVKNSTVSVFLDTEILSSGYYGREAWVGDGIMLSSNGWGVVHAPGLTKTALPKLRMRDTQGTWYTPASVIVDSEYSLIYFKLTGNEFYVASFPDWRILDSGMSVWVYEQGGWKHQTLGTLSYVEDSVIFRAESERQRFKLSPEGLSDAGIVISDTGSVLGFIDSEGRLQDAWMIEYSIPRLLESGVLEKKGIDWSGSMVETIEEGKRVFGFLVDMPGSSSDEGLKRGDIIRLINGNPIAEHTLYRAVRAPQLTVQIWRGGQIYDILIHKSESL